MKYRYCVFLSLCFLQWGCEPSVRQEAEKLQEQVLASHDSAMAQMEKVYSQKKRLTSLRDSIGAKDTTAHRVLGQGINELTQADAGMMEWMHQFNVPDKDKPEEAMRYLEAEKEKIKEVQKEMKESLETAAQLQQQYKNQNEK